MYYLHVIQKNLADNFIFECVREKLFLSWYTVTTQYIVYFNISIRET